MTRFALFVFFLASSFTGHLVYAQISTEKSPLLVDEKWILNDFEKRVFQDAEKDKNNILKFLAANKKMDQDKHESIAKRLEEFIHQLTYYKKNYDTEEGFFKTDILSGSCKFFKEI